MSNFGTETGNFLPVSVIGKRLPVFVNRLDLLTLIMMRTAGAALNIGHVGVQRYPLMLDGSPGGLLALQSLRA
ncbi:hypothetical protein [Actinacidiphila sp. bgisy167]|uniref:hypothetical protein n=1 Tax=Actinacidiphila sp. bgisy167 TaxID=3413797 RepID=UPI003D711103